MKKSLVTFLLVIVAAAAAQQAPPPTAGGQQPAAGQQGAAPQKKEIKDPAEYNAYVAAVQAQDPNQKIASIEAFLQTYPNSVMKEDAAELLMKTYQQTVNMQKTVEAGQRLLQINPNNLTALALLTFINRAQGNQGNAQALQQAGEMAQRGEQALQTAPKPEGLSEADWTKFKEQADLIFTGALAQSALQQKNYPAAQQDFLKVVKATPNSFVDVYQLALSYLEPTPPAIDGLFWIARAVALAQQQAPQAVPSIQRYAKSKYVRYHGSDEGFDQLLATAASSPLPPQGFTVAPAPSPAEQAGMMLQKTPPAKMSFAEWQFVMTSGNQQAADQVWAAIKGKPLQMVAQVISVEGKTLTLAGSADDIAENKADITLTMAGAIPAKMIPKAGQQITFEGTPSSYTANPFMMQMTDGTLFAPKGAAAATGAKSTGAAKKPTPTRKKQ